MRNYSLTLVLRQSLNEASRKKLLETVKDFVKGAKFTKEDAWGEKQLAYPIKREVSGFYQNFMFQTDGSLPTDLEKRINAEEEIQEVSEKKPSAKQSMKKSTKKEESSEKAQEELEEAAPDEEIAADD